VQAETFRPYREVLAACAMGVARRCGIDLPADGSAFLSASLPDWPPFPDSAPALRRLAAAGCRLAILSNVDRDLLDATLRRLAAPIDLCITAEQVRSYKPAHGHFLAGRERLGGVRWLHAAQSWFHDVVPASELGLPVAWVNRKGESPTGAARPVRVVADLAELADWILDQRRGA